MGDQVCGAVHAQGPCSVGLKPSSGCQTETDTAGAEEGLRKQIQSSPALNNDCTVLRLHCTALCRSEELRLVRSGLGSLEHDAVCSRGVQGVQSRGGGDRQALEQGVLH